MAAAQIDGSRAPRHKDKPSALPRWTARQFHNRPAESLGHGFLAAMGDEIAVETGGRMRVTVEPLNGGIPGSDPQVLDMLRSGDLEFRTVVGRLLGRVVPAAEAQSLPFAFKSHAKVHRINEGPLGELLAESAQPAGDRKDFVAAA